MNSFTRLAEFAQAPPNKRMQETHEPSNLPCEFVPAAAEPKRWGDQCHHGNEVKDG